MNKIELLRKKLQDAKIAKISDEEDIENVGKKYTAIQKILNSGNRNEDDVRPPAQTYTITCTKCKKDWESWEPNYSTRPQCNKCLESKIGKKTK